MDPLFAIAEHIDDSCITVCQSRIWLRDKKRYRAILRDRVIS